MPRRARTEDANEAAHRAVSHVISKTEENMPAPKPKRRRKNAAAVALGKLGGKKGGNARAAKLSPERRSEIARLAAERRWNHGAA